MKTLTNDERETLTAELRALGFDEALQFPHIGRKDWKKVCLIHGLGMDDFLYEAMFDVIHRSGDERIFVFIETAAEVPSFEVEATIEALDAALLSHNHYRIFQLALIGPSHQWIARILGTDVGFMAAPAESIDRYVELLGGIDAFRTSMREFWTHWYGSNLPGRLTHSLKEYVGCEDL